MKVSLVDAREGHHAAVLALNEAAVPAVSRIPLAALQRLAQQACYFKVALEGDEVVGFLLVLPPGEDYESLNYGWFSARYDAFSYIDRVVIAPSHIGRGIGRAFYDDLVDWTRGRYPRVACEVNVKPRNTVSLAFHAALGFEEVGQQDTEGGTKRVSMMTRDL